MFVTSRSDAELLSELADALQAAGIPATVGDGGLAVDGLSFDLPVIERAHPNPAELADLVRRVERPSVLVADRISDAGRDVLREGGWSWLDRRGHLRLWRPGTRIEAAIATGAAPDRSTGGNLWTTVGREVALCALITPADEMRARRVAAAIGRSVGATHELIARFTEAGLIGPSTHRPLLPDLFWETSANWPDGGWLALPVTIHEAARRVGAGALIRVDERAATLGGARIAAASDLPARCYVRSEASVRKLRNLIEPANRGEAARCYVRTSPVAWLPELPDHEPDDAHPWRIAHPMICALRLAADPARGREIVNAWGIVPGGDA